MFGAAAQARTPRMDCRGRASLSRRCPRHTHSEHVSPQLALPRVNSEHLFRCLVQGNEGDHTQQNPIAPPHRNRGTRVIAKPCPISHDFYVKLQPATHFTFCSILHSHAMDTRRDTRIKSGMQAFLTQLRRLDLRESCRCMAGKCAFFLTSMLMA